MTCATRCHLLTLASRLEGTCFGPVNNTRQTDGQTVQSQGGETDIDIFVNCNWVNTRWQCYSTHNLYIEQHHNNRTTQIIAQHNNNRKTIAQHNDNYF